MKQLIFGFLAALFGIVAVFGGVGVAIGMIAYSVYLIVLMATGVIAVSFISIFKVVLCWFTAMFCGWLWAALFGFLSTFCAAAAKNE